MENMLLRLALRLSDNEIRELLHLKRGSAKKLAALHRERTALVNKLEKLDRRIAAMTEKHDPSKRMAAAGAMEPDENYEAETAAPSRKLKIARKGRRPGKLTAAILKIMDGADGQALRSSQIVDALPGVGLKVDDKQKTRQAVSMLLSRRRYFKRVGPGLYRGNSQ